MPRSPAAARAHSSSKPRSPRPSTRRGRAAHNALSHGLRSLVPVIPGIESEEDWLAHLAAVFEDLQPVGHVESLCANHIALDFWRLKRIARYEILLVTHSDPKARPGADFDPTATAAASSSGATTADPDRAGEEDEADDRDADEDDDEELSREEWERLEAEMSPRARNLLHRFDLVMFADETQPVDAPDALAVIDAVRGRVCAFPLASFAVPGTKDTPLTQHTAWTGGLVRRTIRAICERFRKDPAVEIATTVEVYRDIAERYASDPSRTASSSSSTLSPLATHPLPPAHILDRLVRYEAHLTRDLRLWQADLERWQARRFERELLAETVDESDESAETSESAETPVSAKRNASTR